MLNGTEACAVRTNADRTPVVTGTTRSGAIVDLPYEVALERSEAERAPSEVAG